MAITCLVGEPPARLGVLHVDERVAVLEQRSSHALLLRLLGLGGRSRSLVLAGCEQEGDDVGARLVAVHHGNVVGAVAHAQISARGDVAQAHRRAVGHEASVPAGAYELEAPEGAGVRAHRACLVEHVVGVLADARLGQSEALVGEEETQHLAAEHVAGVLEANRARRDRHHRPQRLLERRVHAMYQTLHHIDVLRKKQMDE